MRAFSKLLSSLLATSGPGRVTLEIDLDRGVLRAAPENPLEALRAINAPTVTGLTQALREAATDERVAGLVVHVGTCPLSAAMVDEVGAAIRGFGAHKPTVAYAESFGELTSGMFAYRLATSASTIWLQPSGSVVLGGVHVDMLLLRGGLEKLGLDPEFSQRKEFKTAAETYSASSISDANREMSGRLAASLLEETVALVSERRGLTADAVREIVDRGPVPAEEARSVGLVDHLGYRDDVYADVRETWGKDGTLQYASRYISSLAARAMSRLATKPTVAVVSVRGSIVSGRPVRSPLGGPQAGSEVVQEHLRHARMDDNVKAVILAVDSPGGSYIASDTIRAGVLELKKAGKPVVATMGDLAASGGYFVSMGATEIVANPSTLTGSIGVFAGKVVNQGLYDKLGLVREDVQSGRLADMFAGNRGFTDEQWRILDAWLDQVYADFTTKAAADRGMTVEELEPLARGRVWTGADAKERRLVDHLGGREVAVERACALAGLDRDKVAVRPVPLLGLLERLQPAQSSDRPGGLDGLSYATDPVSLLSTLAVSLGLAPDGVLSMPYRLRVG
ncbi:MAG TPA: signal peptide peptidase SppA [Propionibacteriaceae bacterium]|nr:signal peptide peptidase SppA [Propionibacteriaceae bacterium]